MILDIIGSGSTSAIYDWGRPFLKWSVGSTYHQYGDSVDLYFCMHAGQDLKIEKQMKLSDYPLATIMDATRSAYFTNSIAYMLAYAAVKIPDLEEVNIFGVDMDVGSEWDFERPCVAFWSGYLQAMGIKVFNSSYLTEPPFLYGYDGQKKADLKEILEVRARAYEIQAKHAEGRAKDQWIGAMHATKKIIQSLQ